MDREQKNKDLLRVHGCEGESSRAHRFVWAMLLACSIFWLGLPLGCGNGSSSGGWYEQAQSREESKDAFIQHQVDAGLTEREARRLYDARVYQYQTIGRDVDNAFRQE